MAPVRTASAAPQQPSDAFLLQMSADARERLATLLSARGHAGVDQDPDPATAHRCALGAQVDADGYMAHSVQTVNLYDSHLGLIADGICAAAEADPEARVRQLTAAAGYDATRRLILVVATFSIDRA